MNDEIKKVIDHLTQASYNEQRRLFPHIPAKDWGLVYGEKSLYGKKFPKSVDNQIIFPILLTMSTIHTTSGLFETGTETATFPRTRESQRSYDL